MQLGLERSSSNFPNEAMELTHSAKDLCVYVCV